MQSEAIIHSLAQVPFFSALSPAEVASLAATADIREVPAGGIFIEEGTPTGTVYIILAGETEAIKNYGGEGERRLGHRGPGAVLGEMSRFSQQQAHTATVRAVTSVTLFCLTSDGFEALLVRYPKAALEMLRTISNRLEESERMTVQDLTEKNRQLEAAFLELQAAQAQLIEKEKLEHELELAGEIQQSLLPHQLPELAGATLAAEMHPARVIGGDFYGFLPYPGGKVALFAGDVSDKGMPAALGMALAFSLLRAEGSRKKASPEQVLTAVNQHLVDMAVANTFVTLIFGVYEPATGKFSYTRAGHPLPVLVDNQPRVVPVPHATGQALGIFSPVRLDTQEIQLPPGGALLIYSDGVTEAENLAGEPFGIERIQQEMVDRTAAPAELCQRIYQSVLRFSGGRPAQDDMTLLCLRRVETPAASSNP